MRCPACQATVQEDTPVCGQCTLTLEKLNTLLGSPPRVTFSVNDLAKTLSRSVRKGIEREIERFELRFPQLRVVLVTCSLPGRVSLGLYTFWMFNHNQATSAMEAGSSNRLIMIALDPATSTAACMVGYGLEPFFPEAVLQSSLQQASASFAKNDWLAGIKSALKQLDAHMTRISSDAPAAYGWPGEPIATLQDVEADVPMVSTATY